MNQEAAAHDESSRAISAPDEVARAIPARILREYQWRLLDWFSEHGRVFPWRKTDNAFHILIAEILLQQTHSRAVPDIYTELISRYPTPADVAAEEIERIEELIEPLGLAYRAGRIKKLSETLVRKHAGIVPSDADALLELHGVGRYVASAVRLFAFGETAGLVDRNVIRVLDRVFEIQSRLARPHTDAALWIAARILVPKEDAREYNLALLDLAALVCKKEPLCTQCPIRKQCKYWQSRNRSG